MAGKITHVRAAARITKLSKVARVQVTSVALGRNGAAITRNTTPVNSGTAASAVSYSNWVAVTPGRLLELPGPRHSRYPLGGRSRKHAEHPFPADQRVRTGRASHPDLLTVTAPTSPPSHRHRHSSTSTTRTTVISPDLTPITTT